MRVSHNHVMRHLCLVGVVFGGQVSAVALSNGIGPTGVQPLPTGPPNTTMQHKLPQPNGAVLGKGISSKHSKTLLQIRGRVPAGPVTIQEAVAIALSNSPAIQTAVENLHRLEGVTDLTRAAFNPTLEGNFNYTRLKQQYANFGSGSPILLVNPDSITLQADFTLPLDIMGELRAAKDQAGFNEVAARINVNSVMNQTVLNVKNSFYSALRAQALVQVAVDNLNDDLAQLTDAQNKLKAGTAAPFDVLTAQTNVASAQQQLIAARSNVGLAIASLNNAMGIAIDSPITLSDEGAVVTPSMASPATNPTSQSVDTMGADLETSDLGPAYNQLLDTAEDNRPEILGARASLAAAKKGIFIAEKSSLPSVNINAQASYTPNASGFSPQTTASQFGVSVAIPIFDGGVTKAEITQAHAEVDTARTALRQTIDSVNLNVRNAYLTLLQDRDLVAVAQQGLLQAKESYRLSEVRYKSGVSTLVEVTNAEAALSQAESNQVNAIYNYNAARSAMDAAVGRYSYNIKGLGYTTTPAPSVVGEKVKSKK